MSLEKEALEIPALPHSRETIKPETSLIVAFIMRRQLRSDVNYVEYLRYKPTDVGFDDEAKMSLIRKIRIADNGFLNSVIFQLTFGLQGLYKNLQMDTMIMRRRQWPFSLEHIRGTVCKPRPCYRKLRTSPEFHESASKFFFNIDCEIHQGLSSPQLRHRYDYFSIGAKFLPVQKPTVDPFASGLTLLDYWPSEDRPSLVERELDYVKKTYRGTRRNYRGS